MKFRRTFILIWAALWLAEPFLALAVPPKPAKQSVCSTCGMKDACGEVCCCVGAPEGLCHQHIPGLYAAGCTPSETQLHFAGEDNPKWFPSPNPFPLPDASARIFLPGPFFIPTAPSELLNPPPETGFLS